MNRFHQEIRAGFDLLDKIDDEKLYVQVDERWEEDANGIPGIEVRFLIEQELQRVLNEWQRAA